MFLSSCFYWLQQLTYIFPQLVTIQSIKFSRMKCALDLWIITLRRWILSTVSRTRAWMHARCQTGVRNPRQLTRLQIISSLVLFSWLVFYSYSDVCPTSFQQGLRFESYFYAIKEWYTCNIIITFCTNAKQQYDRLKCRMNCKSFKASLFDKILWLASIFYFVLNVSSLWKWHERFSSVLFFDTYVFTAKHCSASDYWPKESPYQDHHSF